jgi:hypothetical protein
VKGSNYYFRAPEPNKNYVFVGDRDTWKGNWHKIGDPITKEAVGDTAYNLFSNDGYEVFSPQLHNANISPGSALTDDQLRAYLQERGVESAGSREQLMRNYVGAAEPSASIQEKLMSNLNRARGIESGDIQPISTEDLRQDVLPARQEHFQGRREKLNELLNERYGANNPNPQQPLNQRLAQSNANPRNWMPSNNNPMRLDGSQVSNAEAANLRQWGSQNIANMQEAQAAVQRTGSVANPAGLGSIAEAAPAAEAGIAAQAPSFLSRAMPLISLGLMANSLYSQSKANRANKEAMEQREAMRT